MKRGWRKFKGIIRNIILAIIFFTLIPVILFIVGFDKLLGDY